MYFMLTTVTTVGFGDITPANNLERTFCGINMILGVVAFSFASGSLSSIMANMDSSEAELNEKILLIQKMRRLYNFSDELQAELNSAIRYEYSKNFDSVQRLMESIPNRLQ